MRGRGHRTTGLDWPCETLDGRHQLPCMEPSCVESMPQVLVTHLNGTCCWIEIQKKIKKNMPSIYVCISSFISDNHMNILKRNHQFQTFISQHLPMSTGEFCCFHPSCACRFPLYLNCFTLILHWNNPSVQYIWLAEYRQLVYIFGASEAALIVSMFGDLCGCNNW